MLLNRWTGQQVVSVKQLAGQEVMPDSQAKGQDFRTTPHSQQVERIKENSECQAVPRQARQQKTKAHERSDVTVSRDKS